jgi:hypothetical protein
MVVTWRRRTWTPCVERGGSVGLVHYEYIHSTSTRSVDAGPEREEDIVEE